MFASAHLGASTHRCAIGETNSGDFLMAQLLQFVTVLRTPSFTGDSMRSNPLASRSIQHARPLRRCNDLSWKPLIPGLSLLHERSFCTPNPQRNSMNQLRTSLALIVVFLSLIACSSSSQAVVNRRTPVTRQSAGNPNVKVWVNTNSGVYHCPNTRWYGNTKSGRFMTQREAQSKGYRPAYGAVCG